MLTEIKPKQYSHHYYENSIPIDTKIRFVVLDVFNILIAGIADDIRSEGIDRFIL